jgi:hypothetical protein
MTCYGGLTLTDDLVPYVDCQKIVVLGEIGKGFGERVEQTLIPGRLDLKCHMY